MLRKARKVIRRDACIALYNSMVLPIYYYCSCVWDICSQSKKEYLNRLQRRAAAIIEGRKVSQNKLHLTFSWPNLQERGNFQKCMLVYKCLNNLAPPYLLDEFKHSRYYHNYNTRHRDLLRLPLTRTSKYQSSFRYNGAETWNSLSTKVRNTSAFLPFRKALKSFFQHQAFHVYLTIRLRARDFYAVIVDEGEARINYHRIEIESEFLKEISTIER